MAADDVARNYNNNSQQLLCHRRLGVMRMICHGKIGKGKKGEKPITKKLAAFLSTSPSVRRLIEF